MIELRKKKQRNTGSIYKHKPVIRIAKATQAKFIVSELIVDALKLNIETEGVMFKLQDKKLIIFKEQKESDNYHLAKCDKSTFRFRSIDLYNYLSDFFKIKKDKEFFIEMLPDKSFKLV